MMLSQEMSGLSELQGQNDLSVENKSIIMLYGHRNSI